MRIIGLTGGSGSGKSEAAKAFASFGAEIIDCDAISRQVTEKGKGALLELVDAFGADILFPDGTLNRKGLGNKVFGHQEKVQILNAITHKYILQEIHRRLQESKAETVVIDAPLLYEAHLEEICDLVVAVTAPKERRIQRICKRDGITEEQARRRIASQISSAAYAAKADVVVRNDGAPEDLWAQIAQVAEK